MTIAGAVGAVKCNSRFSPENAPFEKNGLYEIDTTIEFDPCVFCSEWQGFCGWRLPDDQPWHFVADLCALEGSCYQIVCYRTLLFSELRGDARREALNPGWPLDFANQKNSPSNEFTRQAERAMKGKCCRAGWVNGCL